MSRALRPGAASQSFSGCARTLALTLLPAVFAACNRYEYRELCAPPPPHPASAIAWEQTDLPPGTIEGRIIAVQTRAPIPGEISLEPGGRTWMDHDGLFRVDSLPPGQYTLRVRYIGYMRAVQSITLDGTKGVAVVAVLGRDLMMLDGCGLTKVRKPWWRFE